MDNAKTEIKNLDVNDSLLEENTQEANKVDADLLSEEDLASLSGGNGDGGGFSFEGLGDAIRAGKEVGDGLNRTGYRLGYRLFS
jgi:hypothetical protein